MADIDELFAAPFKYTKKQKQWELFDSFPKEIRELLAEHGAGPNAIHSIANIIKKHGPDAALSAVREWALQREYNNNNNKLADLKKMEEGDAR